MRCLHSLLASTPDPAPVASRKDWWQRHRATGATAAFDQAVLGGFASDRVGYAFASGYQAALRALIPDLPADRLASLCVTERGGGHPRVIETRLELDPSGGYRVTGHKRWSTLSSDAGVLLVVASAGADAAGKKRLRLVRIASDAAGVRRSPMAEPPFAPEIGHDEIDLAGVRVSEADLFPGDGHVRYVRPFRTVEDIHVMAAVFAYLVREARLFDLPHLHAERLVGLLAGLRTLAGEDPSAPATQVALAGVLELSRSVIDDLDRAWGKTESPAHARWERDRLLLSVAASVREKRRARAWERLASPLGAGDEPSADGEG